MNPSDILLACVLFVGLLFGCMTSMLIPFYLFGGIVSQATAKVPAKEYSIYYSEYLRRYSK